MRIATWNIEWFEALFNVNSELLADGEWSRRHNITRATQADAIAYVLERLDAVATAEAAAGEAAETGVIEFATQAVVGPIESVVDAVGRVTALQVPGSVTAITGSAGRSRWR